MMTQGYGFLRHALIEGAHERCRARHGLSFVQVKAVDLHGPGVGREFLAAERLTVADGLVE